MLEFMIKNESVAFHLKTEEIATTKMKFHQHTFHKKMLYQKNIFQVKIS